MPPAPLQFNKEYIFFYTLLSVLTNMNLFACFSCPKCGQGKSPRPPHPAPWWRGECSCSTVMAIASRTTQSATTMTRLCLWTGCDSVVCCVTLFSMSPTKKSRHIKWFWHPAAPTSTLCLPVSSGHNFAPILATSCYKALSSPFRNSMLEAFKLLMSSCASLGFFRS